MKNRIFYDRNIGGLNYFVIYREGNISGFVWKFTFKRRESSLK